MRNKIVLIMSLWIIPVFAGSSSPRDLITMCLHIYISYFLKTLADTFVYIIANDIGKIFVYHVEETIKEIKQEYDEDEDSGSEDPGT